MGRELWARYLRAKKEGCGVLYQDMKGDIERAVYMCPHRLVCCVRISKSA